MLFTPYIIDVPLSVGGMLAKHAQMGDKVHVVSMCYPGFPPRAVYPEARTPEGGLYGRFGSKEVFEREVSAVEKQAVIDILGLESIITFDYEANRDQLFGMDVVDRVTEVLNEYCPDVVVVYWPLSNYTDFTGTTTAVTRAICERHLTKIPQIYFAETLTGRHTLAFSPNIWVDITEQLLIKRKATEALWQGKSLDYFFNPFSLPVSEFRGRECGACHAEAFVALHGGFGLQKRPEGADSNSHPVTMNRTTEGLQRRPFADGVQPHGYGIDGVIDNETARKVYNLQYEPETDARQL